MQTRSSWAVASPGWSPTAELADAGRRVILLDQEGEQSLGGQAFWSFGGLFLVDSPEQRRLRHPRLARSRAAGLAGHRRLRPRGGPLAAQMGRSLRGLRGRREARLAARAGRALLPHRRLGRARRLPGASATATRCRASTSPGAPVPACSRRSCAACARPRRAASSRCASATASIELTRDRRRGRRRARRGARAEQRHPRPAELAHRGRRLRASGRRP